MELKICHNCGEKVITVTEKCPKCGIIPQKTVSPVVVGIGVAVILLMIVLIGLFLL